MCSHFETNAKKCGLCNQTEWANFCMGGGVDFMIEEFCKAEADTGDAGYKNCGIYKLKKGDEK